MTAIDVDGVTIVVGGRTVLTDVHLAVEEGEFIGVLGPNGAGKTTLLRAILGLITPDGGTIRVLGRPAVRGNQAIGYMPQTRGGGAETGFTGRAVVASAIDGQRWGLPWPGAAGRREIDRVLSLVGARELARRPLRELSGGERQRLLLAQALLGGPRILLLDEPLISLDPHHQRTVVELVRRLKEELRVTVLFSAHELNPLLGALDRVLYLGRGHAALGTVAEVITGPVLSRLYGSPIDVVSVGERIFVMNGEHDVEHAPHRHHARALAG